mmetsp:Transcript_48465/g.160596  ORF Transcript_48465/g.160596 Transcript_48465/m.160596 type:complete len:235 (+) Transcript_48465:246-950(+)
MRGGRGSRAPPHWPWRAQSRRGPCAAESVTAHRSSAAVMTRRGAPTASARAQRPRAAAPVPRAAATTGWREAARPADSPTRCRWPGEGGCPPTRGGRPPPSVPAAAPPPPARCGRRRCARGAPPARTCTYHRARRRRHAPPLHRRPPTRSAPFARRRARRRPRAWEETRRGPGGRGSSIGPYSRAHGVGPRAGQSRGCSRACHGPAPSEGEAATIAQPGSPAPPRPKATVPVSP